MKVVLVTLCTHSKIIAEQTFHLCIVSMFSNIGQQKVCASHIGVSTTRRYVLLLLKLLYFNFNGNPTGVLESNQTIDTLCPSEFSSSASLGKPLRLPQS